MNKYRQTNGHDEYDEYICLKCKGVFAHADGSFTYKCCPHCGTVWDGEFTKRNRQISVGHTRPVPYTTLPDGSMICHSPRLILQYRSWITRKLLDNCFASEACEPQWTRWHVLTHIATNCLKNCKFHGYSSSIHMFKAFKAACGQHYDAVRLILQEGTEFKVIKEWERPR